MSIPGTRRGQRRAADVCLALRGRARFTIAALLVLIAAGATGALDWGSFVETSDADLDEVILAGFEDGDFEIRLAICGALGRRAEPDAGFLIDRLLIVTAEGERHQAEHLLRVLLQSLFAPQRGAEALQQRYEANREALSAAQSGWEGFQDSQLRAVLLRTLPLSESGRSLPLLMAAGSHLIRALDQGGGLLPPGETGLLLDFLSVVEQIGGEDFLDPCLAIARLSREKPVIDRARRVSMLLRAGVRPATGDPRP